MITPRRATEVLLVTTRVRARFVDTPAANIIFALHDSYVPDLRINIYNGPNLPNPRVNANFVGCSLREAYERVCRCCPGVIMEVDDLGVLMFRAPTLQDRMKHAIFLDGVLHKIKKAGD